MSSTDCIKKYFGKRENCIRDYHEIRKHLGRRSPTREEFDSLRRATGLLYLWCPEDLVVAIRGLIQELTMRRIYFEPLWKAQEANGGRDDRN